MKTEQYVTIETESWGWVACPLRWVSKPGDEPNTFSSLEGYKRDCDPDYNDHLLTPGCVDLSSMDSIHALANLANDLWDDGILNDLVVEAFNPALAPPRVCPCGHSACCQNFIDTGDAGCIEGGAV